MSENIFVVGGAVQAKNGLYISRRADKELLSLCRAGNFAYVLTPRQLGKSSLMESTAALLATEGIRSVIITLETIGGVGVTTEKWYLGLLVIIADQLTLETDVLDWWEAHSHLGVTQRFTTFFEKILLTELKERLVIFVDEIDTTLGLPFTDDFFAAIRYFHNARAHLPEINRLSFVLIGCATPGDLIGDPKRTPFNIGQRVDLADFTFEEALPLAAGLGLDDEHARQTLSWVMKWTKGHPYLTQLLCRTLAAEGRVGWTEAEVDAVVADTLFHTVKEPDENLKFVRDMLTKRAPDLDGVLATYREIRIGKKPVLDEGQSLIKNHLKLSGVICRERLKTQPGEKQKTSGPVVLRLRNPIYREVFDGAWVKEHMPINWFAKARQSGVLIVAVLLAISVVVLVVAIRNAHVKVARAQREADAAIAQALNERDEALRYRDDVQQTGGINSTDYKLYQKHSNPDGTIKKPSRVETLLDTPERGLLTLAFYSDASLLVTRRGPGSTQPQVHAWVAAPSANSEPAPGPINAARSSLPEDRTPTREAVSAEFRFASFTAPESRPSAPVGNCLNPHPGAFRSWYGEKNGCWVAVYRQWPDGCTHYQWFNACSGTWDTYPNGAPKVYWTACVH